MSSTYRPSAADMKEITSARDIMWIRLRLSHVKDQMDTWGFTLTTVEGPGDDDDDCVPVKGQLAPPSTPDNEYSETSKRASLASARASVSRAIKRRGGRGSPSSGFCVVM